MNYYYYYYYYYYYNYYYYYYYSTVCLSLLEIDSCLTVILFFNLKHVPTDEAVIHDVLEDYIFWLEASKGYGEARWPTTDFRACDQVNCVRKKIRSICQFLKAKMQLYSISQEVLLNFGQCCEYGLFRTVFK